MSKTLASPATVVYGYMPETTPRRVLLFNPPVYDTRFPWSHWQQPVTLLQLATLLRSNKCEVCLIDALNHKSNERLTRRRMNVFTRGEVSINYWRFGQLRSELNTQLNALKKDGWQPQANGWYGFALDLDETASVLAQLREAAARYHRPASLGELEISVNPRVPLDKETAQRFAELGVHRLILYPPYGMDAPALEQWVTTVGETLVGQI